MDWPVPKKVLKSMLIELQSCRLLIATDSEFHNLRGAWPFGTQPERSCTMIEYHCHWKLAMQTTSLFSLGILRLGLVIRKPLREALHCPVLDLYAP